MKKFWLTVAHLAVIGAGTAGVIMFPVAAPIILPGVGLINGLLPSPLPVAKQAV